MADDKFYEFHEKAEKAKEKGKGLKSLRCGENLRYDSEGIYSYGAKIANLDLGRRTIQKLGYWSPTSSTHYNYAKRMLGECYDFYEIENASSGSQLTHFKTLATMITLEFSRPISKR